MAGGTGQPGHRPGRHLHHHRPDDYHDNHHSSTDDYDHAPPSATDDGHDHYNDAPTNHNDRGNYHDNDPPLNDNQAAASINDHLRAPSSNVGIRAAGDPG